MCCCCSKKGEVKKGKGPLNRQQGLKLVKICTFPIFPTFRCLRFRTCHGTPNEARLSEPPPDSAAPPPLPRAAIRLHSVFTAAPSLHQTLQRLHRCPDPPSGFAASSLLPQASTRLCSASTAAPIRHQTLQRLHRCPKPPPDSAAPPPLPRAAIRLRSVFTAAPLFPPPPSPPAFGTASTDNCRRPLPRYRQQSPLLR